MRVLLVTQTLACGGAERVMSWLANQLDELGHSVTLITIEPVSEDFYQVSPGVLRVGLGDGKRRKWGMRTLRWSHYVKPLRSHSKEADVVVSFLTAANIATLVSTFGAKISVVVSERNTPRSPWLRRHLATHLYKRFSSKFVVQSESIAKLFKAQWGLGGACIVPNTCALDLDLREERERELIVLSVGRLVPQKDHVTLIKAWSLIGSNYPDWRLCIVGRGASKAELMNLAETLGISETVDFIDAHDNVEQEYARASIFVLPSLHEGFPNVLVEAASSGCAPIATDCPGANAEILEQGKVGVLFPVGDYVTLSREISRLIEDPQLRARYGTDAMKSMERFDSALVLDMWVKVLSDAIRN